jgi:hypothetical protein
MWSAQTEKQVIRRIYRKGQKSPVRVYQLLAKDSSNIVIHTLAHGKADMLKSFLKDEDGESVKYFLCVLVLIWMVGMYEALAGKATNDTYGNLDEEELSTAEQLSTEQFTQRKVGKRSVRSDAKTESPLLVDHSMSKEERGEPRKKKKKQKKLSITSHVSNSAAPDVGESMTPGVSILFK